MPDAELCEWLLVWSIREDCIREREALHELDWSMVQRERLLIKWLLTVSRRERERREARDD